MLDNKTNWNGKRFVSYSYSYSYICKVPYVYQYLYAL